MTETQGPKTSTLNYGDVVLYNQNGKICNALVLQSQIVPVPTPKGGGAMINEEHLTITFLDPSMAKSQLTQIEMENARKQLFGRKEWSETNPTGWMRVKVVVEDGTEIHQGTAQREYAGARGTHGEHEGG